MIYLDNAATTRVFECAVSAAEQAMRDDFFNPNVTYKLGVAVKNAVEQARARIADIVGAQPRELYFTSCATESNNWVFECGRKNKKGNVVITAGEHASVYEPAMRLKSRGTDVRVVRLTRGGIVDTDAFAAAVDENTALVSVIHVSNETGAVNPVKELVKITRARSPHALFHSDGVQGMVKCGERIDDLGVDFYSASAHKLGGPKGIGLLYMRNGVNIAPMLCGGGQENGLRSGTQNTPYIAAFASAVERFAEIDDRKKTAELRNTLSRIFVSEGCKIIAPDNNSGYILCVYVPDVRAEILQNLACDKGVIVGKGAACSGSKRGNRVLSEIGLNTAESERCLRISLSADTDAEQAVQAAELITECAKAIRSGHLG